MTSAFLCLWSIWAIVSMFALAFMVWLELALDKVSCNLLGVWNYQQLFATIFLLIPSAFLCLRSILSNHFFVCIATCGLTPACTRRGQLYPFRSLPVPAAVKKKLSKIEIKSDEVDYLNLLGGCIEVLQLWEPAIYHLTCCFLLCQWNACLLRQGCNYK